LHLNNGSKKSFAGIKPPYWDINIERLVEWIGALNYQRFVDPKKVTSEFEVLIVIMALTENQIGVDIDEIFWKSSFTNDLGID